MFSMKRFSESRVTMLPDLGRVTFQRRHFIFATILRLMKCFMALNYDDL